MRPVNILIYLILVHAFFSIMFDNVKRSREAAISAIRSFLT